MKTTTKLWIGVGGLILLSPLGLFLPEVFKAGDAWGEWGTETFKALVGYIPSGLEKLSGFWSAPIPDYTFKGWEEKGFSHSSVAYIISAAVGIAVTVVVVWFIAKFLARKEN